MGSSAFAITASWGIAIGKRNSTSAAILLGMPTPVDQHTSFARADYRDRYEDLTGCSLRQCPQCQPRPHGGGQDPAAVTCRQLSRDGRLVMIHHRLRTRNSMGSASPGPRRSVVQLQAGSRIPHAAAPRRPPSRISRPPQSPNPHRPDQQSAGKSSELHAPSEHDEIIQHP